MEEAMRALFESADNTGCSEDLTVVSQAAVDELRKQYSLLTGLQKYPEFLEAVDEVVSSTLMAIDARTGKIESDMPYKRQFILEAVIRRLEARV